MAIETPVSDRLRRKTANAVPAALRQSPREDDDFCGDR
jgi:hypothetical protein